ncbi:piggyBac transposable element-derived protein 4-like [Anthonomus grandis grandis]|uniref:piggyBac transposable element-derived protein 4-like n=1 Tax=Anthonomus grandis grandis TaxID=2921223 RepID=UPI00216634EB|nr:piggyBac transposable element-derived protein 4-like [Anthonomus grandis grandis]
MASFENKQRLKILMDQILSEEESEPYEGSSDDNESSEDTSLSSYSKESPIIKRRKKTCSPVGSAIKSENSPSTSTGHFTYNSSDAKDLLKTTNLKCHKNQIEEVHNRQELLFDTTNESFIQEMKIENVIKNFWLDSSSSEDNDDHLPLIWRPVSGENLKDIKYHVNNAGIPTHLFDNMTEKKPVDFYLLFLTENIIDTMVEETNRYASQKKESGTRLPKSRLNKWKETDAEEMKIFIGLQLWMGLCHLPHLSDYWSRKKIYSNHVVDIMSRNRFEVLLANWHFCDNSTSDQANHLFKINSLTDRLSENFRQYYNPKENTCINETLVSFCGREYVKNKKHKFGVKLYKLCAEGYTYDFKIYCGSERNSNESVATQIVMSLCSPLLDSGRTIYVDDYFTSVELAHKLLQRNTHLVGILKKNRRNNPKEVINKKLERGEIFSRESNTGVIVSKWQEKQEILTLSTKHLGNLIKVSSGRNPEAEKPDVIVDYNKCKSFIDLCDEVKAYSTSLRRGIKWYRKLAVELLLGSAVVNAYLLYKSVTSKKISITCFREELVESLLKLNEKEDENKHQTKKPERHFLEDVGTNNRGRCVLC